MVIEDGEFGDKIRRCMLCSRSPDEKPITVKEILLMTTGKETGRGRRKKEKTNE